MRGKILCMCVLESSLDGRKERKPNSPNRRTLFSLNLHLLLTLYSSHLAGHSARRDEMTSFDWLHFSTMALLLLFDHACSSPCLFPASLLCTVLCLFSVDVSRTHNHMRESVAVKLRIPVEKMDRSMLLQMVQAVK